MPHRLERPIQWLVAVAALALCAAGPMADSPSDLVKDIEAFCGRIEAERAPIRASITKTEASLNDYHFAQDRERPWTQADDRQRREQAIRIVRSYDNLILIRNAELTHYQTELADLDARYRKCQDSLATARAEEASKRSGMEKRPDDHGYERLHGLLPGIGMVPGDAGTSALGAPVPPQTPGRRGCAY